MRKKIFIIHGKGLVDGLGHEGGGDLDTVSSNAFFAAWANRLVREKEGREAEYGRDYEFDFVNYQQGLMHLSAHKGCDVYLPDFPIDALPPRLRLMKIDSMEEIEIRHSLYKELDDLYQENFIHRRETPEPWKDMIGKIKKKGAKTLAQRKFFEIKMATFSIRIMRALTDTVVQEGESKEYEFIMEKCYSKWVRDRARDFMNFFSSPLKWDLQVCIPQEKTQEKIALFKSASQDFGSRARLNYDPTLLELFVEPLSSITGTQRLIADIADAATPEAVQELHKFIEDLRSMYLELFDELLQDFQSAAEEEKMKILHYDRIKETIQEAKKFAAAADAGAAGADEQETGDGAKKLYSQITREENGCPEEGVEVFFKVEQGDAKFAEKSGRSSDAIVMKTDEMGTAIPEVLFNGRSRAVISATFDEYTFIKWSLGIEDSDSDLLADEEEDVEVEDLLESEIADSGNVDRMEYGEDTDNQKALQVSLQMLKKDLDFLNSIDVCIKRFDDHHPYTPEILQLLEQYVEEGKIEAVQLSSLPRGQEQPKSEQKCGADLIYETFIKDTPADNPGLATLRDLAHVQDLHIRFEHLAIELSKLIGSKFSKIEMTKRLSRLKTSEEVDKIMQLTGWEKKVEEYQNGLAKVLPRLFGTLSLIHLDLDEPRDEDKTGETPLIPARTSSKRMEHQGFLSKILSLFKKGNKAADEGIQARETTQLLPRGDRKTLKILTMLSPFCDPRKGEPVINAASAINYLKPKLDFDYLFYCYGRFLMTTRKVNGDAYSVNLSDLVSFIGNKGDGGHPEAATGKPESNPDFPHDRFPKVNARNFDEYIHYIAHKAEEGTGLRFNRALPAPARDVPADLVEQYEILKRNLVLVEFQTEGEPVRVLFCYNQKSFPGQPDIEPVFILRYLAGLVKFDYLFITYGTFTLKMRNINDARQCIDLDKVARSLGIPWEGGKPDIASCRPQFNPSFPSTEYRFVHGDGFLPYCLHLAQRLVELSGCKSFDLIPLTFSRVDPALEKVLERLAGSSYRINFLGKSRIETVTAIASLAPFTDRKVGEPPVTCLNALSHLRSRKVDMHYYFYFRGAFQHTFLNLNDDEKKIDFVKFAEALKQSNKLQHERVWAMTPKLPPQYSPLNYKNFAAFLNDTASFLKNLGGFQKVEIKQLHIGS